MLQAKPLPDVLKTTAHGQRRRSQHSAFQLRPQAFAQDGSNIDRRRLEKNILSPTSGCLRGLVRTTPKTPSSPFNPKHRVAIFGFHGKPELCLNFLRAADEVEYLLWLLRQTFEFAGHPGQRLIQ